MIVRYCYVFQAIHFLFFYFYLYSIPDLCIFSHKLSTKYALLISSQLFLRQVMHKSHSYLIHISVIMIPQMQSEALGFPEPLFLVIGSI